MMAHEEVCRMTGRALFLVLLLYVAPALGDIKVGVYSPFTGGAAGAGISMRNGVVMATEEINQSGGILGQQLVLVIRDDEAKNERGAQIMQEFLEKEKVVAVLGPSNTGVADNSTRYANEKQVPVIINSSAGAKVNEYFASGTENYIFRLAASDFVQTELIVRDAIDVRKHQRPALICDDTNYGQGGCTKLKASLAKRNILPVSVGKFRIKDTDMTAQVQEARAAGADVLFVYGIGPELAALANSMDRIGWKVDLLGGWSISMEAFVKNAGKNGNGATTPLTFIEGDLSNPRQRAFVEAYHLKYNQNPISVAVAAAQGYDSVYLLKAAIEQARSTDGVKIKDALENLKAPFDGITGMYARPFTPTDHEAVTEAMVRMAVVLDGRVVPEAAAGK
jgi:branched-chain amino acid transport system substrate-binding protein